MIIWFFEQKKTTSPKFAILWCKVTKNCIILSKKYLKLLITNTYRVLRDTKYL